MQNDIRMQVVELRVVRQYISNLSGKWIYIKFHNRYETYSAGVYTKFQVKSVDDSDNHFCYIYGFEDEDRLVFNWDQIVQTEITSEGDEILVRNEKIDIYIRNYNPIPDMVEKIPSIQKNLIITEGKTDWKLMKAALSYYNKLGRFVNDNISFLEYEDELGAGNDQMAKVRDYNAIFPNDSLRIFIFDADDLKINQEHSGKKYVNWGNNVYSFILPVPKHRKETPQISIENLFTDEEIKTEYRGRRLYLADEFGTDGRNKEKWNVMTLETKKVPNHIIDRNVYYVEDSSITLKTLYNYSKATHSIALSKNDFAENVLYRRSGFDSFDFSAFEAVFEIIEEIYCDYVKTKHNIVDIGRGIELENCNNGFRNLFLNLSVPRSIAENFSHGGMGYCGFEADFIKNCFYFIFTISMKDGNIREQRFPAEVSKEIVDFLVEKSANNQNRIIVKLHIDDNLELFSSYEILKDDISSAVIQKELNHYFNKGNTTCFNPDLLQ